MAKKHVPKTTPQAISDQSAKIEAIYTGLQQQIFNNFMKHLKRVGVNDLTPDSAFYWQLEKMSELHIINKENIDIAAKYAGIGREQLADFIQHTGHAVYDETGIEIETNLRQTHVPTGDVDNILNQYVNQTFISMDNLVNQTLLTTYFGDNQAMKAYQSMIEKSVAHVVSGVTTKDRAINDVIQQWTQKGLASNFVDRAGRRWSFQNYARTVIQSTTYRVYNEMRTQRMSEFGIVTAYLNAHPASRPAEATIQGGVVLVVPKDEAPDEYQGYPSIYDYGYGEPWGCRGINCHHILTPFIPGVNEVPELGTEMDGVTPEVATANGKLQAKQRSLERNVRKSKELLNVATKQGDIEAIQKYSLSVRNNQGKLRNLVGNHSFLHRDYQREKYFAPPKLRESAKVPLWKQTALNLHEKSYSQALLKTRQVIKVL